MQLGHDDFSGRNAFFAMNVGRDTASIIFHFGGAVRIKRNITNGCVASEGFVNRIIDDFIDHVVQARTVICVPNIHARALAHGIKAFEDFDGIRAIGGLPIGITAILVKAFGIKDAIIFDFWCVWLGFWLVIAGKIAHVASHFFHCINRTDPGETSNWVAREPNSSNRF